MGQPTKMGACFLQLAEPKARNKKLMFWAAFGPLQNIVHISASSVWIDFKPARILQDNSCAISDREKITEIPHFSSSSS
jgi:hypothetical protein